MSAGGLAVVRGDARSLPLPDNTVDLIVTSPPYFALRSYTDGGEHYDGQLGAEPTPAEFVAALVECTREMVRVLKPTGSLWVNLGDKYGRGTRNTVSLGPNAKTGRATPGRVPVTGHAKSLIGLPWRYALACIDTLGLILRAEIIWSKPNGLPESVTDRVRRSHEQWFHFTLQPRYYAAVDEIRQPYAPLSLKQAETDARAGLSESQSGWRSSRADGSRSRGAGRMPTPNPLGALPGSVWSIPTEPLRVPPELGVDHFAAFPSEWPRRLILGWSPQDGIVLDPFGGTGTTAHVAAALGRTGISVDLSADYCRLAAHPFLRDKRAAKVGAGPKPVKRPSRRKPKPDTGTQTSLLDLLDGATADEPPDIDNIGGPP